MSGVSAPVPIIADGGFSGPGVATTKPVKVITTNYGVVPTLVGVLTAQGTQKTGVQATTDLFLGSTSQPALGAALTGFTGFALPAGFLIAGRLMRMKAYVKYTNAAATSPITINLVHATAGAATPIGTAVITVTSLELGNILVDLLIRVPAANLMQANGNFICGGTQIGSISTLDAGTAIVSASAANLSLSILTSGNNAGDTYQLVGATLELLN